ncbi:Rieske (2Fe-2S) protein [Halobellus sp. Atlit-38R]|jgi:nitrite reductase/ring-hydroxylating ferredoxin subunit|uniref:Rieske (2Fe-2S) protein n=1 Tax=Halobellus sp. Atlit-38R TaxID=2282131 RepID=UPI000EF26D88|nr:Rieske (2Fe-2S) protein [Halobellus sp. Atlit-38R]RLM88395.1 Rieske (2Fe-2S) protein [Halobellus sp. Atlit-38R]
MSDGLVEVGPATEFEDGDHAIVEVGRAEVGVVRADGEFYALRNQCPHDGGPVCTGTVQRELLGEFTGTGERVEQYYGEECIISCPWHGWSFELETGTHIGDERIQLPMYDVVVEDGIVYVDTAE